MRHLNVGRKLGRTASHRKATMRALSIALIKNHRIVTTVAKAKELRRYFEPLVTKAKEDTTHRRRQLFSFLRDKEATTLMFDEIAAVVGDRPGGYTRIIKLGTRSGDGAEIAMIELVDFNDVKPETKSSKKKRTRRGSGGGKKSTSKTTAKKGTAKPKADDEEEVVKAKSAEVKEEKADKPKKAEQAEAASETKEEKETEVKAEETETAAEEKAEPAEEAKSEDVKEESDPEKKSDEEKK